MERKKVYAIIDEIKTEVKAKEAVLNRCCEALSVTRQQIDTEKTGIPLWIRQKIYGPTRAQIRNAPNALVYSRSYPLWLPAGTNTGELHGLAASYNDVWNRVAWNFQDERRKIRSYYESIADAPNADVLRKQADFSRIKRLKKEMSDFVWSFENRLPTEMLRSLEKRLNKVLARAGKAKWDKGYPTVCHDDDFGLDVYFNGRNLEMGDWNNSQQGNNSYVSIGPQHDPANHHGRRGGRRANRQMRQVEIVLPRVGQTRKNDPMRFSFDMLVHDPERLPSTIKGVILTYTRGHYSLTFQLSDERPVLLRPEKKFCGINIGWRSKNSGAIAAIHVYGDGDHYTSHAVQLVPNRFSRRFYNSDEHLDLPPYVPTMQGKEEFQREMDKREDQIKTELGEWLKKNGGLPTGWQHMGKRGMLRLPLTESDIATMLVRWLLWDARCSVLYAKLCASIAARIRHQYFVIANQICQEYSDIGVPSNFVKSVAEGVNNPRKRAKMTEEEKAIADAAAKHRQLVGPAGFIQILKWVAKKHGCRVHTINQWMFTRRCHSCKTDNPSTMEETYVCIHCGKIVHVDENNAQWTRDFARECSGGDGPSRGCSRDGKSNSFIGFLDAPQKGGAPGRLDN